MSRTRPAHCGPVIYRPARYGPGVRAYLAVVLPSSAQAGKDTRATGESTRACASPRVGGRRMVRRPALAYCEVCGQVRCPRCEVCECTECTACSGCPCKHCPDCGGCQIGVDRCRCGSEATT